MQLDIEEAKAALREHTSVEAAAKKLGIPASTLRRAFKRVGLTASGFTLSNRRPLVFEGPFDYTLGHKVYTYDVDGVIYKPIKVEATPDVERVLICPDVHVPYQDDLAWRTFLNVAKLWNPHVLVVLGDFCDFYQVSQWPKDPSRRLQFKDELEAARKELAKLIDLTTYVGVRRIFCEGNHETRLARYIASTAPAMHGVVDARSAIDPEGRFEWVPYGHHASVGKLAFTHDVGAAGENAARQSVRAFGGNIIFGHTHRASSHYESTVNGERHAGFTMGWLGDPEAIDYRHRARVLRENQHGFGVAYVERSTGIGWAHFVPIIAGRACVDGVLYDGRSA